MTAHAACDPHALHPRAGSASCGDVTRESMATCGRPALNPSRTGSPRDIRLPVARPGSGSAASAWDRHPGPGAAGTGRCPGRSRHVRPAADAELRRGDRSSSCARRQTRLAAPNAPVEPSREPIAPSRDPVRVNTAILRRLDQGLLAPDRGRRRSRPDCWAVRPRLPVSSGSRPRARHHGTAARKTHFYRRLERPEPPLTAGSTEDHASVFCMAASAGMAASPQGWIAGVGAQLMSGPAHRRRIVLECHTAGSTSCTSSCLA